MISHFTYYNEHFHTADEKKRKIQVRIKVDMHSPFSFVLKKKTTIGNNELLLPIQTPEVPSLPSSPTDHGLGSMPMPGAQ
jgi:uncharacterized protein YueI